VHTIIGGLDADGKGAVYSFDPVGSYEREQCRAGGAAASLIMPFLDNQVRFAAFVVASCPLSSELTTGKFQKSVFGEWGASPSDKVTA
jgi:20S proteasome alpha/beta subunit